MVEDTLLKGTVLEIQRMSTEDGPGIRTTVFMKGCPMHCLWCHNPESISSKPQIQWIGIRCIGCRTCEAACPNGGLQLSEEGMTIDREKCEGCGTCAEECPSTALELLGKDWAVSDLADELLKDSAFFDAIGWRDHHQRRGSYAAVALCFGITEWNKEPGFPYCHRYLRDHQTGSAGCDPTFHRPGFIRSERNGSRKTPGIYRRSAGYRPGYLPRSGAAERTTTSRF